MAELTPEQGVEVHTLIVDAHNLYSDLLALPLADREGRRAVWSEIVEMQSRISALMPPATEPLSGAT